MTVENDFLMFANAATNIESQASYAADPAITNGVGSGTASSAQANKVWRQSTTAMALLAAFIQQQSPSQTVLDGGAAGLSTLLSSLTTALLTVSAALAGFSGLTGSAPGGTQTASWTVKQVIAKTSLTGLPYAGGSLSLAFNGATTGAGGMDTGTLPSSATDFAVYAIYDPATAIWSTLGTLESSGSPAGPVYGGAHMPAGYTASVLIWAGVTDTSGHLLAFSQVNRDVYLFSTPVATGLTASSWTSLNISGVVPAAAISWRPDALQTSTSATSNIWFSPTNSASNGPGQVASWSGTNQSEATPPSCPILSPQATYYHVSASQTWTVTANGYAV